MKKVTVAIAVAAMAVLSFSSCKKDDDNNGPTGRAAQVVGTWTPTFEGLDDNQNGIWEASEKTPATLAGTLKFESNGTGSVTLQGVPFGTLTWSLMNNDNDLRVIQTLTGFGTDTTYFNIVSLTANEAIVRDTTVTPFEYSQFSK